MNEKMAAAGKLSWGTRLLYSAGQFADSIPFNIFYFYFLFFFTDVVGLSPAAGGTISLIVIIWDACTDPVIGYLSDNCNSKYGRRRPFMIAAIVPLFACTLLLFTAVDFGAAGSFAYYLVVGILFWSCYKVFVIPYFALGAELTQDFNERNTLRSVAGFVIYLASWFTSAGPMFVWDQVLKAGGDDRTAWMLSAAIFGAIGLIGGLVCWNFTRGKELAVREDPSEEKAGLNFFTHYRQLFSSRAMRHLLFSILFYCISFAIQAAALVYMMSNNLAMSEASQAVYWTAYAVITFILLPIINAAANRFGKKPAMIVFNIITAIGCVFYFFKGIDSYADLIGFTILYQFGGTSFWTIGYSLTYDCCEVDEFVYGKRREGSITGFASFSQKLGSAVGMWVCGILLTVVGYNAELAEQTANATHGILMMNTLFPGIVTAAGTIFVLLYPINKKNFAALMKSLELKRQGLSYTTEGFDELIQGGNNGEEK
ncbi:MAG: glycoside-pentoside-hexuronide (GPH):cation symporter [Clostridiales Family XIII bacterium]|jgi:GPH family glycoside/pentoside/hexuronide:cation symporter|nr:glycoside-pentoside-hexuronide (GPH):cation symporter [Clostridiales Family XIII bacterium]